MQKLIFIFLIALSACVASSTITTNNTDVSSQSTKQHVALNKAAEIVELSFNQVTQFENLTLRVIAIEDSRCAIGVTCIWAGQMVVKLEVTENKGKPVQIKLVRKRESAVVNALGYAWRLNNLEPHPKKDRVIHVDEQVVQLEIVKTDNN